MAPVVVLEARPVYGYLSAQAFGTPLPVWSLAPWFAAAALVCIVTTLVPLRIALTRLEAVER